MYRWAQKLSTTLIIGLETFLVVAKATASADPDSRAFSIPLISRPSQDHASESSVFFPRNIQRYGRHAVPNLGTGMESVGIMNGGNLIVPFTVGASVLHLNIDTGSSDLWVFSQELLSNQNNDHHGYHPSVYGVKSETQTWKIRYADGSSASGVVYHDVVGLGDTWAMDQAVEVATAATDEFLQNPGIDGILGLGFSTLNKVRPQRQTTFFENIMSQLKLPVFAVNLKQNGLGSCDFGFVNQSNFAGDLNYVEVNSSRGHWRFRVDGYIFGDGFPAKDPIQGVVDTGASLIYLPDYIVRGYYLQIEGAENSVQYGAWTIPCTSSPPSFTLLIGKYQAVIGGHFIKLGLIGHGSSQCLGGVQSNMGAEDAIFGGVFLSAQYVVFDAESPRLGFAPQL